MTFFFDPIDYFNEADFREPENPIPIEVRHDIACFLEACGRRPNCSTGIGDEDTRGYGRLDSNGYWEYPL